VPIFEYKCNCEKVFEVLQLPGLEKEVTCPECGGTQLKKLISAPFLPSSVGRPANDLAPCGAEGPEIGSCEGTGCAGCQLH
jgi:putative FmdB family regulatory protein